MTDATTQGAFLISNSKRWRIFMTSQPGMPAMRFLCSALFAGVPVVPVFRKRAYIPPIEKSDSNYHVELTNVKLKHWQFRLAGRFCSRCALSRLRAGARRSYLGVSTTRPEIRPLRRSSRTSLAAARGRSATWQRTFPSAAIANTSRRSWRVPTADACI